MKYMSEYEIMKVLDGIDREYVAQMKSTPSVHERKFAHKAHFVIGKIKRDFIEKFKDRNAL